ncbi:MAG: ECF-type sigma factor [Planctomycetota bacterium]
MRDRFRALYEDLHRVSARILGPTPPPSLLASDLMHDAFVKLQFEEKKRGATGQSSLGAKPDSMFKACFGAACRDVLADHARRRRAKKRGGDVGHEEAASTIGIEGQGVVDAVAMADLLDQLAAQDPRLAELVDARVFGGMSVAECAELFGVSSRTIDRDWQEARSWLSARLRP